MYFIVNIITTIISKEGIDLAFYLFISFLTPLHRFLILEVHFVYYNNKRINTKAFGKMCMFCCLAILLKSSLEFSFPGRYYKCTNISLTCSLNHIWNIVFMARSIQDSVSFSQSLKKCFSNFNCFAFFSFLLIDIHNVCHIPGFSVRLFGFFF